MGEDGRGWERTVEDWLIDVFALIEENQVRHG